jgi:uncharacterized damage-inducible protein DinB
VERFKVVPTAHDDAWIIVDTKIWKATWCIYLDQQQAEEDTDPPWSDRIMTLKQIIQYIRTGQYHHRSTDAYAINNFTPPIRTLNRG